MPKISKSLATVLLLLLPQLPFCTMLLLDFRCFCWDSFLPPALVDDEAIVVEELLFALEEEEDAVFVDAGGGFLGATILLLMIPKG